MRIHAVGNDRHKMSSVDIMNRTATCSICGPTRIYLRKNTPRCFTKAFKAFCDKNNIDKYIGFSEIETILGKKPTRCPVCLKKGRMCIDHDHETKELRGWLCDKCNVALGYMCDDYDTIIRLSIYIKNKEKETK